MIQFDLRIFFKGVVQQPTSPEMMCHKKLRIRKDSSETLWGEAPSNSSVFQENGICYEAGSVGARYEFHGQNCHVDVGVSKNRGKSPKMDGLKLWKTL